jgi:hypothetical protein
LENKEEFVVFPYALPIIADTAEKMQTIARTSEEQYSYYEFWLDYLPAGQLEFAKSIAEEYGGHAIFLLRRQNLEPTQMAPDLRRGTTLSFYKDSKIHPGQSFLSMTISLRPRIRSF